MSMEELQTLQGKSGIGTKSNGITTIPVNLANKKPETEITLLL